jgi:UDP-glucuronate 4-epimerase
MTLRVLISGCAGFIGMHAAERLLSAGFSVTGVDSLNSYYDPALKAARLERLGAAGRSFDFHAVDCSDPAAMSELSEGHDLILHLAAQAGVRHSLVAPFDYVQANVRGQLSMLEAAAKNALPLVYASSSSVYGSNAEAPFRETDRVDGPVSLYAATKRSAELITQAYRSTHGVRASGLRFFTVYGPWGRPDMAPWLFADAIMKGEPIRVFNNGEMQRDFTHIDDIVDGIVAACLRAADPAMPLEPIYNLGNNKPRRLMDFIAALEAAAGHRAVIEFAPMPKGDVLMTCADISLAARDLGYAPRKELEDGLADFVPWLRGWLGRNKL